MATATGNVEQVTKDIEEIKNIATRKKLRELGDHQREIQQQIADLELQKKSNNADIMAEMKKLKLDKVTAGDWQIIRSITERRTIKADLLLKNGVHMDVIEASTEVKETESVSVRATAKG